MGSHFGGNAIDIAVMTRISDGASGEKSDGRFSFLSFAHEAPQSEAGGEGGEVKRETVFEIASDGTIQSSGGATFASG